jgi:manganese/zinc/iron transport system substrate-binding protein
MNLMSYTLRLLVIIISVVHGSCISKKVDDKELTIVATTGMIADIIYNVVGDSLPYVKVVSLMGEGVDPHLYKATARDVERLQQADIIFYNGLHLEGKMTDVLEKLSKSKPVIPVSKNIPDNLLRMLSSTQHDPHIWFDVRLWKYACTEVVNELSRLDSLRSATYHRNAKRYLSELDSLDTWVKSQIALIPKEQRVLITAHDAFGYFGSAYNIDVIGLQGISTVGEFSVQDVMNLASLISLRKIKSVFIESSVPKRSIEAVVEGVKSRGSTISIGGELYSDAMGSKHTPEGTYIGMVKANVRTIVNGLR